MPRLELTLAELGGVQYAPWASAGPWLADRWHQGEHVTLIGPTGVGKTTLAERLLPMRDYVLILASKPRDTSLRRYARHGGYRIVQRWQDVRPPTVRGGQVRGDSRVILWPPFRGPGDRGRQRAEFEQALESVWAAGGWTVYADELYYLTDLGLRDWLDTLWTQGRSLGLTVVGGVQRPRNVSLNSLSQASWLYLWRSADAYDLRRVAELDTASTDTIATVVAHLPPHEVLVVQTRTGDMIRTRAPRP